MEVFCKIIAKYEKTTTKKIFENFSTAIVRNHSKPKCKEIGRTLKVSGNTIFDLVAAAKYNLPFLPNSDQITKIGQYINMDLLKFCEPVSDKFDFDLSQIFENREFLLYYFNSIKVEKDGNPSIEQGVNVARLRFKAFGQVECHSYDAQNKNDQYYHGYFEEYGPSTECLIINLRTKAPKVKNYIF